MTPCDQWILDVNVSDFNASWATCRTPSKTLEKTCYCLTDDVVTFYLVFITAGLVLLPYHTILTVLWPYIHLRIFVLDAAQNILNQSDGIVVEWKNLANSIANDTAESNSVYNNNNSDANHTANSDEMKALRQNNSADNTVDDTVDNTARNTADSGANSAGDSDADSDAEDATDSDAEDAADFDDEMKEHQLNNSTE